MKVKSHNILLYGYVIYLISNIFLETEISSYAGMNIILRVLKYIGILFCMLSCYDTLKINKKIGILLYGLFFLACINAFFMYGGSELIEILILVICFTLNRVEISSVFRTCIYTLISGHIFVMLLSRVGMINDQVSSRWFGNYMGSFFEGEYIRHQMGFLSSNQVPLTLMIAYLMMIVYKQQKVNIYEHIFFLIANFWCFFNFGSRVSFLVIIVTFCIFIFIRKVSKIRNKKKCKIPIMWLTFPGCTLISIMASYFYDSTSRIWGVLNQIFYNRIRWSHAMLKKYGFSILGVGSQISNEVGPNGENIIDNGYILLVLKYGILIMLLIVTLWSYITYMAEKKQNKYMVLALVMIAGASLIDSHLLTYKMIPFYCVFTLNGYDIQLFMRKNKA